MLLHSNLSLDADPYCTVVQWHRLCLPAPPRPVEFVYETSSYSRPDSCAMLAVCLL